MEHLKYHINWFSRISEPSTANIYNILIDTDTCKDLSKPELSLLGDSSRDLFIPKRWRSLTAIERVTFSLTIPKRSQTRRIGRWIFFCKVPSPNTQCMVYLPTNLPSKLAIHVGKIYQTLGVSVILGCLPRPNLRKASPHGTGFPHEMERGSRRQTVLARDGWSHFNSLMDISRMPGYPSEDFFRRYFLIK